MFIVCAIMNGLSIRLSVWCFDQKWWLHAYNGKTTYGLCFTNYIIYAIYELIQTSSLLSGDLFLCLSYLMPWIDFLTKAPFRDHSLTFEKTFQSGSKPGVNYLRTRRRML
jgi:hypothetical protein